MNVPPKLLYPLAGDGRCDEGHAAGQHGEAYLPFHEGPPDGRLVQIPVCKSLKAAQALAMPNANKAKGISDMTRCRCRGAGKMRIGGGARSYRRDVGDI